MLTSRLAGSICSGLLVCAGVDTVYGQEFPYKPMRLVTSGTPGSALDGPARLIAQGVSSSLGQQMIVDNRVDVLATAMVAKSPPDGYTLLITGASFIVEPLLRKTPHDPVRDFSPVTWAISPPSVLVVNNSLKANSVKDLIVLAKAKPGALNYGSAGVGGAAHLAAELFNSMAGINVLHVPYTGSGPALVDLFGDRIQISFVSAGVGLPHASAGRLRALAVTTAQPSALAPGLPTMAATLPGYEAVPIVGIYVHAKTSPGLINRLNGEIVRVLNQPSIKEQLLNMSQEVVASTPEKLAFTIKSEIAKWSKLIKDLGLRAE